VVGDFMDSVLNMDSRIFRTIGPLLFKPGYLTEEYFAGRRVRYVTPFRLFFFLCVVSFFAAQIYLDASGGNNFNFDVDEGDRDSISAAKTPAEVQQRLDAALAGIEAGRKAEGLPEAAKRGMEKAEAAVRKQAEKRVARLKAIDDAKAAGKPAPPDPADDEGMLSFDGKPWDIKTHPIEVSWLPKFGNERLNLIAARMQDNIKRARHEPKRLVDGLFSVLPQTLFVLMPLFAVLLKALYLFKRRLYMEHLIVALHSHAFIAAAMLLMALFGLGQIWLKEAAPVLATPLGWGVTLFGWWIPLYLLIMQKRVYRQGWFMTLVKYSLIGICYSVLIGIGVAVALVVSLAVQ
jgi:hypothetical protein